MDAEARSRYERRVRDLVGFGHRGTATDHERRAADYLAGELRGLGLDPLIEPFATCRAMGARLLVHVAVAAVGAALLWRWPIASVLLGLSAFGSLALEQTTRGVWLGRALPAGRSRNVSARLAPRRGPAKSRLVVCGHYDSQRTGLLWNETLWASLTPALLRLPAFAQSTLFPLSLAMIGQSLAGLAALAGAGRTPLTVVGVAVLCLYAIYGALLADWTRGAFVPGAADNASGASAVLTLGECWRDNPRDGVELVLLLTGSEETGALGASAWADRHRADLRALPTTFLNLDGLGFGPPRFVGWEVPLAGPPVRYPVRLLAACAEVADESGLVGAGPYPVPGFTDGLAFLVRGLPGITVIGSRPDGRLPNWHLPTDDDAHMDFDAAWQGVIFAASLMPRLVEAETGSPAGGAGPTA